MDRSDPVAIATIPLSHAAGSGRPPQIAATQPAPQEPPAAPTVATAPAPAADDAAWSPLFGGPALGPDTFAVAVDGERVYVGGDFFYGMAGMANETYNRIAMWDGKGWQRMGSGLGGAVHAIAVVGTDVYAGGEFTIAGGNVAAQRLARWDGERWFDVAGGLTDPDRSYGTAVRTLACDGATLYVGGTFTRAGDVVVRSLAALDLATGEWSDAAGGVASSWSTEPAEVRALAIRGSEVFVGGTFDQAGQTSASSLASLDTATGTWTAYGAGITDEGMQGTVSAIAVDGVRGDVYVGGRFTTADQIQAWNLAVLRADGFASLGDVSSYGGKYAEVKTLAAIRGGIYAGGSFTAVGNATASHWAYYDGAAWSSIGDGVDNVVKAMAPIGEDGVVVLGDFVFSGDLRMVHGGIWTADGWRTFGHGVTSDAYGNGTVSAISPTGDGVYVGGLFDQAAHLPAGSIARWTGSEWDTMQGGVRSTYGHGQVFALAQIGGDLYVAGLFDTAGGTVANNIARWDGATWSTLGAGLDGAAHAMAVLGGKLYVGGTFNLADRVQAGHLACWDPATQTWSAVGNSPTYDDDIKALAVIGDRWLVVGGTFHRFFHQGTTIVEGLWGMALFDTHAERTDDVLYGYRVLEGTSRYGAPGWIHALHVVGGDLFVGGWFDVAGIRALTDQTSPGFPAANIAVWHFAGDGRWEDCVGTDHQVQALQAVGGTLAVGGWFSTAGNVAAGRVARFDPGTRTWTPLGSGLSDGARGGSWALSLAQSPDSGLWVGGEFPSAGSAPSANLALWTATKGE